MTQPGEEPTYNGHEIPRVPGTDYKTTPHFMERLKYRTDPSPKKDDVHTIMWAGTIKHTHIPDRFIFEYEIDGVVWWIIVEMNEEAFENENKYHTLVSIYAPYEHEGDHKTVFEVDVET